MADWIDVYPTSSIFLKVGQTMQLTVREWHNPATVVNTNADGTEYLDFDNSIATVVDGNITAIALGETIVRVRHTDLPNVYESLVRVMVKVDITELWFGNNRATIRAGADNYVLTVFAKFSDNTFGDISSHPFLVWTSSDSVKVGVDGEGRISGGAGASGDSANITVTFGALTDTVAVSVSDSYATPRPILDRIHGSGDFGDKKNILFLGDGFSTAQDRLLFNHVVSEIVDDLLLSPNQVPYNLLEDNFNVWVAYEPSSESGVTPTMPVRADGTPVPSFRGSCTPSANYDFQKLVQFVGLPDAGSPTTLATAKTAWQGIAGFDENLLTSAVFSEWKLQRIIGYMQAKDSLLGIKMGVRWGERRLSVNTSVALKNWYLPGPVRRTSLDQRRLFLNWDNSTSIDQYIASLRVPGLVAGDPNFDVNTTWHSGGADTRLVCILVNDDIRGGTNFGRVATSLGKSKLYSLTKVFNIIRHTPTINRFNVPSGKISGTVAHEFAHSFRLGDEYEGYDDPNHQRIDITNTSQTDRIDSSINLTHHGRVQGIVVTQIEGSKIPWNWHRIEKLSITKNVVQKFGGNKVKVRLKDTATANIWNALPVGTEVFFRHKDINKHASSSSSSSFFLLGPLTIDGVSGDEITLDGGQPANVSSLPAQSQLYVPLKNGAGTILTVVDPAVVAHLDSTGIPFADKTNCANCDKTNGVPDASIPGFIYPRFRTETIGLYEGGGTFNCGVYRPNGAGRMRIGGSTTGFSMSNLLGGSGIIIPLFQIVQKDVELSFVDKYVIVNAVAPEKLPNINTYYPS